ncbi:hypothetical protein LG198_09270 [Methylobacillus arboreus]|uniref:hypothetical protein n=1 Tax=Methylobacillus arboreus TaxID=755170 RepID=UPI001E4E3BF8|nr:hypothetical protein [Methylobacillus arboreus]MCB5190915.1 hypothetical protein [Methylobacillus arboreus]
MIKTLLTMHRSRIYAGLTFAIPFLAFAPQSLGVVTTLLMGAIGIALALHAVPVYIKWILAFEDRINLKLGLLTPARFLRTLWHVPLVLLINAGAGADAVSAGGILLLVLASSGLQALAIAAAYKGWGDRVGNSLMAFAGASVLVTLALAFQPLLYLGLLPALLLCGYLGLGILSDFRSVFYPKSGVGVFFGSFNPIHKTHIKLLQQAIQQRGLSKVYLHPTTVPKLHRVALEQGELSMAEEGGMRVYSKTALADPYKNYFPTGRKFYEYEVRQQLLQAAIRDAGLQDKVEVLDWPGIYDQGGFFAVLDRIKAGQPPDTPFHGIHGSDVGGIWVRNIFELSGGIHPYPVVRSDCISATAIREGAVGYTTPTIEAFLAATRAGQDFMFPTGYLFKNNSINRR